MCVCVCVGGEGEVALCKRVTGIMHLTIMHLTTCICERVGGEGA